MFLFSKYAQTYFLPLAVATLFVSSANSSDFGWPKNKKFALSITYDDGYFDNVDVAIPHLNKYGIRGTFYLTPSIVRRTMKEYGSKNVLDSWKKAALSGHEIGNHSATHRCAGTDIEGVSRLETIGDLRFELQEGNKWLNENIVQDYLRSFSYPCGEAWIGTNDSIGEKASLTEVRKLHLAARWASAEPNTAISFLENPLKIRAMPYAGSTNGIESIKEYLFNQTESTLWLVLVFHSISEDGVLNLSPEVHEGLIEEINDSGLFWIAPVRDVASYILRYHR